MRRKLLPLVLAVGVAACESSTAPTVSLPLEWNGWAKQTVHAVGNIDGNRGEETSTFEALDVVWDEDPLLAPVSDARSYKIKSGRMKWTLLATAENEEGQCTRTAESFGSLRREDGYLLVNAQGRYSGWIKPRREVTTTYRCPGVGLTFVSGEMELGLAIAGQTPMDVDFLSLHPAPPSGTVLQVTVSGMAGTSTSTWYFLGRGMRR